MAMLSLFRMGLASTSSISTLRRPTMQTSIHLGQFHWSSCRSCQVDLVAFKDKLLESLKGIGCSEVLLSINLPQVTQFHCESSESFIVVVPELGVRHCLQAWL